MISYLYLGLMLYESVVGSENKYLGHVMLGKNK